jgi:hypothetical protein
MHLWWSSFLSVSMAEASFVCEQVCSCELECFAVVVGLEFRGWFMWRRDLDGCRLLVHLDQIYLQSVGAGQCRKNVDGLAVSTSYFYLCLQPFQCRSNV